MLTGDEEGRGAGQLTAGARSRDLVLAAVRLLSVANTQRVLVSRARHRYLAATRQLRAVLVPINQSISFYLLKKCPEIGLHIKGFSIASRTTRLRPALTAAQLINYTMKEKEKFNAYKIAYGSVHIHIHYSSTWTYLYR